MALGDLFTGALSWRRLIALLEQLPPTSRLARARDPRAAWAVTDYLTAHVADGVALVADELATFRWLWTSANRKSGTTAPKRPQSYPRLPRPGQQPERAVTPTRRRMTPGEAARAYAARKQVST